MKIFTRFTAYFLLLCFAHSAPVFAGTNSCQEWERIENIFNEYKVIGNKIYIQPDQLYISNNNISIFVQGEQVFVQQLNCDDIGVYCFTEHLDTITDKCKNGHKIWCTRCWGCVVRWCNFHCRCVEWGEFK